MGYSTDLQVYVYDCPEDQLAPAGEVLAGMNSEEAVNGTHYAVVDETRNVDGKPIRRGQEALTLVTFATRGLAEEYAGNLPGAGEERYSLDEVPAVTIGERYLARDVGCGSAEEYADALSEAAPGTSFVLWEEPTPEWLGTIFAYTPDLGMFTAECDTDGNVTLSPDEICEAIRGARPAVKAALAAIDGDEERARVAIDTLLAEVDRKAGRQWFDRMPQAELAASQQHADGQARSAALESGDHQVPGVPAEPSDAPASSSQPISPEDATCGGKPAAKEPGLDLG